MIILNSNTVLQENHNSYHICDTCKSNNIFIIHISTTGKTTTMTKLNTFCNYKLLLTYLFIWMLILWVCFFAFVSFFIIIISSLFFISVIMNMKLMKLKGISCWLCIGLEVQNSTSPDFVSFIYLFVKFLYDKILKYVSIFAPFSFSYHHLRHSEFKMFLTEPIFFLVSKWASASLYEN